MELVRRIHLMREISREARGRGKKIAFVPTMGALHEGHLSLVRRAREYGDLLVVSVFVNPQQFGPAEDFERYPRDLTRDADLCLQEDVHYLFAPEAAEMHPAGFQTFVEVAGLSRVLEGASRPGHFRGVATVVLKLFNIVRPHFAFFGQKDAQQAIVLRRMARDLNLDVELIVCPTVRHQDGLAMSSRNVHLGPEERAAALALHRALEQGRKAVEDQGARSAADIEAAMRGALEAAPLVRVDYAVAVGAEDLERRDSLSGDTLLLVAGWVGATRLIDSFVVRARPVRAAEGETR